MEKEYFCSGNSGKERRIQRILSREGKCLIVPIDDSLISGPKDGLFGLRKKIEQIEAAKPSALLAFSGSASLCNDPSIPLILNLTASTLLGQHTNKVLVSTVEHALHIGADAVAVHFNFSSRYESNMLQNISDIRDECNRYGLPLMILAYPRGELINDGKIVDNNYMDLKKDSNEKYTQIVAHCVRIAFELGADIIKTQYTGSTESFERVVKSAPNRPVLIAGGGMMQANELLQMVESAMRAGGAGVSIGRNVFNQENACAIIEAIKSIVFLGETAKQAEKKYI